MKPARSVSQAEAAAVSAVTTLAGVVNAEGESRGFMNCLRLVIHLLYALLEGLLSPEKVLELMLDASVRGLGLDKREFNCLEREGVYTIRDLIGKTEQDLLDYRNLGDKGIGHIKDRLALFGFGLKQVDL